MEILLLAKLELVTSPNGWWGIYSLHCTIGFAYRSPFLFAIGCGDFVYFCGHENTTHEKDFDSKHSRVVGYLLGLQ